MAQEAVTPDKSPTNGLTGEARDQLGAAVQEVRSAVGDRAEEIAARATRAGADTVAAMGRTAETLASSLEDQSPALADYVRSTAMRIDRLADDLREKSAGELLGMATEFGKQRPLILLAGAAVVGFALSRVVKAGLAAQEGGASRGTRSRMGTGDEASVAAVDQDRGERHVRA